MVSQGAVIPVPKPVACPVEMAPPPQKGDSTPLTPYSPGGSEVHPLDRGVVEEAVEPEPEPEPAANPLAREMEPEPIEAVEEEAVESEPENQPDDVEALLNQLRLTGELLRCRENEMDMGEHLCL